MKFEEVLPALREGKKIKRRAWRDNSVVWKDHKLTWAGELVGRFSENILTVLLKEIVEDNDWEIVVAVRDFKVGDQVAALKEPRDNDWWTVFYVEKTLVHITHDPFQAALYFTPAELSTWNHFRRPIPTSYVDVPFKGE
jgi:hypothetical protein